MYRLEQWLINYFTPNTSTIYSKHWITGLQINLPLKTNYKDLNAKMNLSANVLGLKSKIFDLKKLFRL